MISSLSVDVGAPPAVVFGLARDVERWSALLPHYRMSRRAAVGVDGSVVVSFVAVRVFGPYGRLGLPVAWRARTWSDPRRRQLRFVHLGGATAGMDVTWRIDAAGDGSFCRVTIEHVFSAPPLWAAFVDRFFTRPIAGRTLATFRALAEGVVQSGMAAPTNRSV